MIKYIFNHKLKVKKLMDFLKNHLIGKLSVYIKILGINDFIEFDNFKDICDLEDFNDIHYYKILVRYPIVGYILIFYQY
jgi:hypothetical protein